VPKFICAICGERVEDYAMERARHLVSERHRKAWQIGVEYAEQCRMLTTDEQKAMQRALRKSSKLIAKGQRI